MKMKKNNSEKENNNEIKIKNVITALGIFKNPFVTDWYNNFL